MSAFLLRNVIIKFWLNSNHPSSSSSCWACSFPTFTTNTTSFQRATDFSMFGNTTSVSYVKVIEGAAVNPCHFHNIWGTWRGAGGNSAVNIRDRITLCILPVTWRLLAFPLDYSQVTHGPRRRLWIPVFMICGINAIEIFLTKFVPCCWNAAYLSV